MKHVERASNLRCTDLLGASDFHASGLGAWEDEILAKGILLDEIASRLEELLEIIRAAGNGTPEHETAMQEALDLVKRSARLANDDLRSAFGLARREKSPQ